MRVGLVLTLTLIVWVGYAISQAPQEPDYTKWSHAASSSLNICQDPPEALLPRDRWDGSKVTKSKDGGVA